MQPRLIIRILLFDLGEAILPPRPQGNCAGVSSGSQGWPPLGGHPKGLSLMAVSTPAGFGVRGQKTIMTAVLTLPPSNRAIGKRQLAEHQNHAPTSSGSRIPRVKRNGK